MKKRKLSQVNSKQTIAAKQRGVKDELDESTVEGKKVTDKTKKR